MKKTFTIISALLMASAAFATGNQQQHTTQKHITKKHTTVKKGKGDALNAVKQNTTTNRGSSNKTGKGNGNGNAGTPASPATPNHPPQ